MNNIILNYLLKNYFKYFFLVTLAFYCFGIILNLFEEVEFFKYTEVNIFTPLLLTCIFVPSLIIKLLPFIIFISSVWYMVKIRNNKDLLTLKVYGYSNIKIFFILAFASFLLGWIILFFVNPMTSSLIKYYEKTKSNYARDIDHLVSFNNNGLWIKEYFDDNDRVITASTLNNIILSDLQIFEFNKDYKLTKTVQAETANIQTNEWILKKVKITNFKTGLAEQISIDEYLIKSNYNYNKLINLFNNSDTFSFIEILLDFKSMLKKGYNEEILKLNLYSMMTLPFYLFVMTGLASVLTLHTMKNSQNFNFIIIGLVFCVIIYYFKDLSLALGKTDRIPMVLSIWSPVIALSFFTLIGVIQINEK